MRILSRLVYNYKKFRLAARLARFDLLFLLDGSVVFKDVIMPARFFVKPSSKAFSGRLETFAAASSDSYAVLFLSEMSALAFRSSKFPGSLPDRNRLRPAGTVVLKEKASGDSLFYHRLFGELAAVDFSAFPDAPAALEKRLCLSEDMRLYASEQEDVMNLSPDSHSVGILRTNWVQTSARRWVVDSSQDFELTAGLTPDVGKNLAHLFARLLFVKEVIVAGWSEIAVDSGGRVSFAGVDAVYPASYEHRLFALGRGECPRDFAGFKLRYALEKLKSNCPEALINEIFAEYASSVQPKKTFLKKSGKTVTAEYFPLPEKENKEKNPGFWTRYIRQKNKIHAIRKEKNMLFYWGPAFLVALILFMLLHRF